MGQNEQVRRSGDVAGNLDKPGGMFVLAASCEAAGVGRFAFVGRGSRRVLFVKLEQLAATQAGGVTGA
jgi:hypothetical protein